MKRICYAVAMSLDGYIAGPNGEADWIPMDPDMDFAELWSRFDILLMGRKTYEMAQTGFEQFGTQGPEIFVASRTLRREDAPNVTIISELTLDAVASLRVQAKKDIWLFGGGELFRSLLAIGAVTRLSRSDSGFVGRGTSSGAELCTAGQPEAGGTQTLSVWKNVAEVRPPALTALAKTGSVVFRLVPEKHGSSVSSTSESRGRQVTGNPVSGEVGLKARKAC